MRTIRIVQSGMTPRGGAEAVVPAAAAFSPDQLASLRACFKADSLSLSDGDPVGTWTDSSGNSKDATGSGTQRPTYKTSQLNGKPALQFNGTSNGLATPTITLAPFTIYSVFKASADGFIYEQSADSNNNDGLYLYTSTGCSMNYRMVDVDTRSNKNRAAAWGSDGAWRVVTHRGNSTHASHEMWINNANQSLTDCAHNFNQTVTDIVASLYIGTRAQTGVFLTGFIAEVILYQSYHGTDDMDSVTDYLNGRYAIY